MPMNLTGQKFGQLTVISFNRNVIVNKSRRTYWNCKCECGRSSVVNQGALRNGATQSCGFHNRLEDRPQEKHGLSKTPEYKVWKGMRRRCLSVTHKDYDKYGGRGISICKRWMTFANFFADMGQRPSPIHEIERRDNDGNYEPSNCFWMEQQQQAWNRRNSIRITVNEVTKSLAEWSHELGVNHRTLVARLKKGWSHERIVSIPVKKIKPRSSK